VKMSGQQTDRKSSSLSSVVQWHIVLMVVVAVVSISGSMVSKRVASGEMDSNGYAIQEEIAIGTQVVDIINHAGLHVYGIEVCIGMYYLDIDIERHTTDIFCGKIKTFRNN